MTNDSENMICCQQSMWAIFARPRRFGSCLIVGSMASNLLCVATRLGLASVWWMMMIGRQPHDSLASKWCIEGSIQDRTANVFRGINCTTVFCTRKHFLQSVLKCGMNAKPTHAVLVDSPECFSCRLRWRSRSSSWQLSDACVEFGCIGMRNSTGRLNTFRRV